MNLYLKVRAAKNRGSYYTIVQQGRVYAKHKGKIGASSRDAFPYALCPPKDEILLPL